MTNTTQNPNQRKIIKYQIKRVLEELDERIPLELSKFFYTLNLNGNRTQVVQTMIKSLHHLQHRSGHKYSEVFQGSPSISGEFTGQSYFYSKDPAKKERLTIGECCSIDHNRTDEFVPKLITNLGSFILTFTSRTGDLVGYSAIIKATPNKLRAICLERKIDPRWCSFEYRGLTRKDFDHTAKIFGIESEERDSHSYSGGIDNEGWSD